jgi:hypothetical protein
MPAIQQISYARASGDHYRPFWRIDFKANGQRSYEDVQAQNVMDAAGVFCRDRGIPFTCP